MLAGPGSMGESAAVRAGLRPEVAGELPQGAATDEMAETTADDTRAVVSALVGRGADLILFAGGDGTARDVAAALGAPGRQARARRSSAYRPA